MSFYRESLRALHEASPGPGRLLALLRANPRDSSAWLELARSVERRGTTPAGLVAIMGQLNTDDLETALKALDRPALTRLLQSVRAQDPGTYPTLLMFWLRANRAFDAPIFDRQEIGLLVGALTAALQQPLPRAHRRVIVAGFFQLPAELHEAFVASLPDSPVARELVMDALAAPASPGSLRIAHSASPDKFGVFQITEYPAALAHALSAAGERLPPGLQGHTSGVFAEIEALMEDEEQLREYFTPERYADLENAFNEAIAQAQTGRWGEGIDPESAWEITRDYMTYRSLRMPGENTAFTAVLTGTWSVAWLLNQLGAVDVRFEDVIDTAGQGRERWDQAMEILQHYGYGEEAPRQNDELLGLLEDYHTTIPVTLKVELTFENAMDFESDSEEPVEVRVRVYTGGDSQELGEAVEAVLLDFENELSDRRSIDDFVEVEELLQNMCDALRTRLPNAY